MDTTTQMNLCDLDSWLLMHEDVYFTGGKLRNATSSTELIPRIVMDLLLQISFATPSEMLSMKILYDGLWTYPEVCDKVLSAIESYNKIKSYDWEC